MSDQIMWWFAPEDLRLPNGDGRPVVIGETHTVDGPVVLCQHGLHASPTPLAALDYAGEPFCLCAVTLGGEVVSDQSKAAAAERTYVAVLTEQETYILLRRFACWSVRHTPLADGRVVWDLLTDDRSRAAVEVSERFCDGQATKEELAAAWSAAWDAARAADCAADWNAARAAACAAARAAAWAATWAATWDAAWSATWAADWNAASYAASDAARDAAWSAARDAQSVRLTDMAREAMGIEVAQ